MKRMVGIITGVAVFGVYLAVGTGAPVRAQGSGTRVAVINMYTISKGYNRIKAFKDEIKRISDPYDGRLKKYQDGYKAWTDASKNETDPTKRQEASKNALAFKRALEDTLTERNKKLMELADRHVVTFYREIEEIVGRYAKSNGIHLVLYYYEPLENQYTAPNIQRKLSSATNQLRAANPLYVADGVDISQPILQMLNQQHPVSATTGNGG